MWEIKQAILDSLSMLNVFTFTQLYMYLTHLLHLLYLMKLRAPSTTVTKQKSLFTRKITQFKKAETAARRTDLSLTLHRRSTGMLYRKQTRMLGGSCGCFSALLLLFHEHAGALIPAWKRCTDYGLKSAAVKT